MAHLTNFSFEFVYEIFTEDASLLFLYHGAKKSKLTKTQIRGGGGVLFLLTSHLSSWWKQPMASLTETSIKTWCWDLQRYRQVKRRLPRIASVTDLHMMAAAVCHYHQAKTGILPLATWSHLHSYQQQSLSSSNRVNQSTMYWHKSLCFFAWFNFNLNSVNNFKTALAWNNL